MPDPLALPTKKLPLPGEHFIIILYSRNSDLDGIHTVLPTSSEYRYSPSPDANDSRIVLSNLLTCASMLSAW